MCQTLGGCGYGVTSQDRKNMMTSNGKQMLKINASSLTPRNWLRRCQKYRARRVGLLMQRIGFPVLRHAGKLAILLGGLLMQPNLPAETATNGNRLGSTDVGIWYCTYYGDAWTNVGGMGYPPTLYRPLCSNKPGDFRTYNATNVAVVDFHLQQIAAAKIDFLLFELTPGGLGGYRHAMDVFVDNARVAARRLKIWNDTHAWKIRYAIAAGAHPDVYGSDPIGVCMEREAQDVYDHFYNNPDFGGPTNYYQLDGKPLIVYWGALNQNISTWASYAGDKTYGNHFAVRFAQDVISGSYGWNIYANGTVINREVEVVSPGWGHYKRAAPPYVSRRKGDFYAQCWNTVLTNPRPRIVMIVAFNDYLENTAVWTADTTHLTDADQWIGHDGQPHPSMYWDLTVRNIQALKEGKP